MVGEGVVGEVGHVCHIRTAKPEEGKRVGWVGDGRPFRGQSFGDRLVVGPFGERLVRGQSLGDRLVVGPFGERRPGKASDGGNFWGSGVSRPKR